MCLLVLAWQMHAQYRLVIAANRDEFHDRPADPLAWWPGEPRILAGRDRRGGGTWMGAARSGRFGVVTNYRDLEPPPSADAPSRGDLVPGFLRDDRPPAHCVADLRARGALYAGFSVLLGTDDELLYFSNRNGQAATSLGPGVYGLSNHLLDSPWPKLQRTRAGLTRLLGRETVDADALFTLLADREPADDDEVPDTGLPPEWERALSAPFVVHGRYGTRCSTLLLVGHDGRTTMHERRFDAGGRQTGATRFEFVRVEPSGVRPTRIADPAPPALALNDQHDASPE